MKKCTEADCPAPDLINFDEFCMRLLDLAAEYRTKTIEGGDEKVRDAHMHAYEWQEDFLYFLTRHNYLLVDQIMAIAKEIYTAQIQAVIDKALNPSEITH